MPGYSVKNINTARYCPYCRSKPEYDKKKNKFICKKCGAQVNVDSKGRPLGSVANKGLAYKRWYAHSLIEPLGAQVGRANVYRYLDKIMGRGKYKTHTAKMSEIQLDIMIGMLEHTTAEDICERMGIVMKSERDWYVKQKDLKNEVNEIVSEKLDEFYKSKVFAEYNEVMVLLDKANQRIKELEFDKAFVKFEVRLKKQGLKKRWTLRYEVKDGYTEVRVDMWRKSVVILSIPSEDKTLLTPYFNQCKVPFKMWEGQNLPTFKKWLKDQ